MTEPLPSTSRSLPIALLRAREGVMAPIRDMLADCNITEQQWRVLRVLAEHGPLDATTLAERASLLMPSLTRIVQTMCAKGLISQQRHRADRRKQVIALAAPGQDIIDTHTERASEIVDRFKAQLGAKNYEALLDLLALLDPSAGDPASD